MYRSTTQQGLVEWLAHHTLFKVFSFSYVADGDIQTMFARSKSTRSGRNQRIRCVSFRPSQENYTAETAYFGSSPIWVRTIPSFPVTLPIYSGHWFLLILYKRPPKPQARPSTGDWTSSYYIAVADSANFSTEYSRNQVLLALKEHLRCDNIFYAEVWTPFNVVERRFRSRAMDIHVGISFVRLLNWSSRTRCWLLKIYSGTIQTNLFGKFVPIISQWFGVRSRQLYSIQEVKRRGGNEKRKGCLKSGTTPFQFDALKN